MRNLKYIAGELPTEFGENLGAVIFPEFMSHADVARYLRCEVRSAGFFYVNSDNKVNVYGKSVSLNVESNPEDVKLLNKVLGLNDDNFNV